MDQKEIDWLLKEKYNNKPKKIFEKDLLRLKKGEPIAYVIGFAEFLGFRIDLSKKPLIPRPETEYWAQKAIQDILTNSSLSVCRVLDVFTGSGCIGLAVLKNIKNSRVVFSDKNKKSIEQIKINLRLNRLIRTNKPMVVRSDVFESIDGKYDYIFANPPYIPTLKKSRIQKSVLKYEPKQALFAGKDGLFFIRKFLKDARKYLKHNGKIFMEFDSPQKKEIEKLFKKYNYKNYEFHKDQFNRWRWVSAS